MKKSNNIENKILDLEGLCDEYHIRIKALEERLTDILNEFEELKDKANNEKAK